MFHGNILLLNSINKACKNIFPCYDNVDPISQNSPRKKNFVLHRALTITAGDSILWVYKWHVTVIYYLKLNLSLNYSAKCNASRFVHFLVENIIKFYKETIKSNKKSVLESSLLSRLFKCLFYHHLSSYKRKNQLKKWWIFFFMF